MSGRTARTAVSDGIIAAPPRGAKQHTTMRSAVIASPRRAEIVENQLIPVPPATQVRIRIQGCGVCGSNVPVWNGGEWFKYPLEPGAPGHEGWGIVDAVGESVTDINVGDRVAALSYHAFAEYDLAEADAVVKLPAALDGQPFPGEALGCAMNVMSRCDVHRGQWVTVIGIGFLGAIITQLAVSKGARVIAISRRAFALKLAAECGAIETMAFDDRDQITERISLLTKGAGCERVIEAVGHQRAIDLATEITAVRGRMVIAGYHQDGQRCVNMQQWNWRGIDVINAHERDPRMYVQGMSAAVQAVVNGTINPTPLYTHQFSLDQVGEALDAATHRPDGFLKALVLP